jgi:hypothetical protein
MAQDEKVFANGFSFKRQENAPDFVVGRLSLKEDEAKDFLRNNFKNGWCNLNIKKAKSGSYYVELDTYEPKSTSVQATQPQGTVSTSYSGTSTTTTVGAPSWTSTPKVDDDLLPF